MPPEPLLEKQYSEEERKKLAAEGKAKPDGSYPIVDRGDLDNAIQAWGRGGATASDKAWIKKRAADLNATDALPADWKESLRATYFAEVASLLESTLEDEQFVAHGVTLIRPGFSKNTDKSGRPRYYPPDMLKRDAAKFEGVRSYANHPRKSDEKDLPERDVRDITGYFENVKASEDGTLKADYRVVGSARQWLWPLIKETAHKPDLVELSINALGETSIGKPEGKDAVVIEAIVKGNSVDNVTTGAAGGSFAGALLASDPDQWTADLLSAVPFEQWRESHTDYVDRLKAEWKTVRETEALKESQATTEAIRVELKALQEKYQADTSELATYRRATMADRILEASGLPFDLRKPIREELLKLETEQEMQEAVERSVKTFKLAPKDPIRIDQGKGTPAPQVVSKPITVPKAAAMLFGLKENRMPREDESAEEYKQRVSNLSE